MYAFDHLPLDALLLCVLVHDVPRKVVFPVAALLLVELLVDNVFLKFLHKLAHLGGVVLLLKLSQSRLVFRHLRCEAVSLKEWWGGEWGAKERTEDGVMALALKL